ncbi:MAG: type II toxin-antitoxin system HicB family antitoxin [Candidatus Omnitrophota bacterium]
MKLKVVLEKGEDGYICASCPSLKGCHSQGKTEAEAMKNIKEAILLFLEPAPKEVRASARHKIFELAV